MCIRDSTRSLLFWPPEVTSNVVQNCCRCSAVGKPRRLDSRDDCPRGYHLPHRPLQFRSCRSRCSTSTVSSSWLQFSAARFSFDPFCVHASVKVPGGCTVVDCDDDDDVNVQRRTSRRCLLSSDPPNFLHKLFKSIMYTLYNISAIGHQTV